MIAPVSFFSRQWRYGDMASVSVPGYQPEPVIAMYLSRIADHHFVVIRPSGKYRTGDEFFIPPEREGEMTYLPDPVPSSAADLLAIYTGGND